MQWLFESYIAIRDFLELGGPILAVITGTIFLMWILIIERIIYFRTENRTQLTEALNAWTSRQDHHSWNAHQIREALVSRFRLVIAQELLQ